MPRSREPVKLASDRWSQRRRSERRAGAGRASWCLWAQEEADNYLYHLWADITDSYHSRRLKITVTVSQQAGSSLDRGFLQTLWIHEDVMPVRLSVSVNFSRTGRITALCSLCPCHSCHAFFKFAYSCCEITCKTCAKMCADYIKQSVIIHSPHISSLPRSAMQFWAQEQVLEYSKSWVLRSSKYLKFRPNQELVSG